MTSPFRMPNYIPSHPHLSECYSITLLSAALVSCFRQVTSSCLVSRPPTKILVSCMQRCSNPSAEILLADDGLGLPVLRFFPPSRKYFLICVQDPHTTGSGHQKWLSCSCSCQISTIFHFVRGFATPQPGKLVYCGISV